MLFLGCTLFWLFTPLQREEASMGIMGSPPWQEEGRSLRESVRDALLVWRRNGQLLGT